MPAAATSAAPTPWSSWPAATWRQGSCPRPAGSAPNSTSSSTSTASSATPAPSAGRPAGPAPSAPRRAAGWPATARSPGCWSPATPPAPPAHPWRTIPSARGTWSDGCRPSWTGSHHPSGARRPSRWRSGGPAESSPRPNAAPSRSATGLCVPRLHPARLLVRGPPPMALGRWRPHRPGESGPGVPSPPPGGPRRRLAADPRPRRPPHRHPTPPRPPAASTTTRRRLNRWSLPSLHPRDAEPADAVPVEGLAPHARRQPGPQAPSTVPGKGMGPDRPRPTVPGK
jgi:hypothetical protein